MRWKLSPLPPVGEWRPWFAWFPVFIPGERDEVVWLERVERAAEFYDDDGVVWAYRRAGP